MGSYRLHNNHFSIIKTLHLHAINVVSRVVIRFLNLYTLKSWLLSACIDYLHLNWIQIKLLSIMYVLLMVLLSCAPRQNVEFVRFRIASKWPSEDAAMADRLVFSSFVEHRQEIWLLTSETPADSVGST